MNFQPPDPALAQRGESDGVCRLFSPPTLSIVQFGGMDPAQGVTISGPPARDNR